MKAVVTKQQQWLPPSSTTNQMTTAKVQALSTPRFYLPRATPQIGSDAPAFTVNDQNGAEVTLASFKGQKNVVVYFYPKDATVSGRELWC